MENTIQKFLRLVRIANPYIPAWLFITGTLGLFEYAFIPQFAPSLAFIYWTTLIGSLCLSWQIAWRVAYWAFTHEITIKKIAIRERMAKLGR